jgi:hypothetical protein
VILGRRLVGVVVDVVVKVLVVVEMAAVAATRLFQRGKMSGNDEWCWRV